MNMYNSVKILSDGDQIVVISGGKTYAFKGACVTSMDWRMDQPMMDFTEFGDDTKQFIPGLPEISMDISFRGGMMSMTEDKNVFDMKKMAKYTEQINQEVKAIALKRALEF